MSSKISFEGIGEVVATFACGAGVAAGQVVKVTADGTVGTCSAGEKFCGVALSAEDGYAAVQLGGADQVAADLHIDVGIGDRQRVRLPEYFAFYKIIQKGIPDYAVGLQEQIHG